MDKNNLPHNVIIEDSEKINISGVIEAIGFDESLVTLEISRGIMIIKGQNLHAKKLNLDNGEITLEGYITSIEYDEGRTSGKGFFSKLFG